MVSTSRPVLRPAGAATSTAQCLAPPATVASASRAPHIAARVAGGAPARAKAYSETAAAYSSCSDGVSAGTFRPPASGLCARRKSWAAATAAATASSASPRPAALRWASRRATRQYAVRDTLPEAELPTPPCMSLWMTWPRDANEPSRRWLPTRNSAAARWTSGSTKTCTAASANDFSTKAVSHVEPALSRSPKAENEPSACRYVSSRW